MTPRCILEEMGAMPHLRARMITSSSRGPAFAVPDEAPT